MESMQIHDYAVLVSSLFSFNNLYALLTAIPVVIFFVFAWHAGRKEEEGKSSFHELLFSLEPTTMIRLIDVYVVLVVGFSVYGPTRSWLWAISASLLVANFFLNAELITMSSPSISAFAKEEGKNKTIVMLFFGWEIIIYLLITEDEDDEESAVVVKKGCDYYRIGVIAIVMMIVGQYFYWWHTLLSVIALVYLINAGFFFTRKWRIDEGCGFWKSILHLMFLSNLFSLLFFYGIRAMQTKHCNN
jgi:hypothetical protein